MPVVTRALDTQHATSSTSTPDVVQIGAPANMQNYALPRGCRKLGKPVLSMRGLSSRWTSCLQAADYILKEGNEDVILCERGIRTFERRRASRSTSRGAWLKLHTHLP